MTTRALLFGGIGTLVETSELQREAFNAAFMVAGLDWVWDRETYRNMLATAGGARRVRDYAASVGFEMSETEAADLHKRKSALFHQRLRRGGLSPRPGVAELIQACGNHQVQLGLASTTDKQTLTLLLEAAGITPETFAVISDRDDVEQPKPDGEVYRFCVDKLGVAAADAVAIEDSESGLQAALDAGIRCVVTPGANTLEQDYSGALQVVASLEDGPLLDSLFGARAA